MANLKPGVYVFIVCVQYVWKNYDNIGLFFCSVLTVCSKTIFQSFFHYIWWTHDRVSVANSSLANVAINCPKSGLVLLDDFIYLICKFGYVRIFIMEAIRERINVGKRHKVSIQKFQISPEMSINLSQVAWFKKKKRFINV